jgi:hypothetical protein
MAFLCAGPAPSTRMNLTFYNGIFMELANLVYISSTKNDMSEDDLLDILHEARTFNSACGITGLLLYRDYFFIQVLEGDYQAIEALFERISKDSRHSHILKLYTAPISERRFSQWAMGFASPNAMRLQDIEGFAAFFAHQPTPTSAEVAKEVEDYVEFVLEQFRQPISIEYSLNDQVFG